MTLFPAQALRPGVRPREVFAWALYDFGNSSYVAVVITSVYASYFVGVVAASQPWATLAWTATLSLAHWLVMLTSPALGRLTDRRGCKKPALALVTVCGVASTAALALPPPGAVAWAMLLVLASYACYLWSDLLLAAFLPELAHDDAAGRVSGWGSSLGAVGGTMALGLCLAYVSWARPAGLQAAEFVPVTMLLAALMYGGPTVVTFLVLRERAQARDTDSVAPGTAPNLLLTLRQHPNFSHLLLCGALYQAGVAVALSVSAIYAQQVVGFRQDETIAFILVLYVASASGSFACGYLQDRTGHKLTLGVTLAGWVVTCIAVGSSSTKPVFWTAALLTGLCIGACLSVVRGWVGVMAPPHRAAEFFGLWTFVARLASVVGPASYGLTTWLTAGDHAAAIFGTTLFFVASLVVVMRIRHLPPRPRD